jgi:1-deoxy-D-xylulose-5-phosphate reductoisomerase
MRTPIAHALAWPDRITSGVTPLDLLAIARLDFEPPDEVRFPCLRLARQAMQAGGTATAILNAANEVAVGEFLSERIRFTDIARVVELTLEHVTGHAATTLEVILADDRAARAFAGNAVQELAA